MTEKQKRTVITFSIFGLLFAGLEVKEIIDRQKLKKDGVYVIGEKVGISNGGKRGKSSEYRYFLNGNGYDFSYLDGGTSNTLLFFIVLPKDPQLARIVDNDVPRCLSMKDVPLGGWKELPNLICDSNIISNVSK